MVRQTSAPRISEPAETIGEPSAAPASRWTIAMTSESASSTPAPSTSPEPFRRDGGQLFARDGISLPQRCVCCGDTLDLRRLQTFPGGVRYVVCREHFIGAIAKFVAGLIVSCLALWQLASPVLDGRVPRVGACVVFLPLLAAGMALLFWAVPLHAGPNRGGWRRLYGAHTSVGKDPVV